MKKFIYILLIIILGGCSLLNKVKSNEISSTQVVTQAIMVRDTISYIDSTNQEVTTIIFTPKNPSIKFNNGKKIKITDKYFDIDRIIYQTSTGSHYDTTIYIRNESESDTTASELKNTTTKTKEMNKWIPPVLIIATLFIFLCCVFLLKNK